MYTFFNVQHAPMFNVQHAPMGYSDRRAPLIGVLL
jgi:hypothetical protein